MLIESSPHTSSEHAYNSIHPLAEGAEWTCPQSQNAEKLPLVYENASASVLRIPDSPRLAQFCFGF